MAFSIIAFGTRLPIRALLAGAAALIMMSVWTAIIFALLTRADFVERTPIVIDGWFTLHEGALQNGASTAVRMVAMILMALLGCLGTTSKQLASALSRQCRIPYRLVYGVVATMGFVSRYRSDLLTIQAAQQARGIIDPFGPIGYLRRMSRSIVPFLAGAVRHAERLSLAMDARGFGAFSIRHDRQPAVFRATDAVFILSMWGSVLLISFLLE